MQKSDSAMRVLAARVSATVFDGLSEMAKDERTTLSEFIRDELALLVEKEARLKEQDLKQPGSKTVRIGHWHAKIRAAQKALAECLDEPLEQV